MVVFEKWDQHHASKKPANMRQVGHAAACVAQGLRHSNKLSANPYSEHKPSWQINESEKNREQIDSILKKKDYVLFNHFYIRKEYLIS